MEDYCNDLWPLIYDQNNHGRHEQELDFYSQELATCSGSILEIACGTGMILLPLLDSGFDIYGFDLSEQMLEKLFEKAIRAGHTDIQSRVTKQNMINFQYNSRFDAVFIPARSFLHLTTQEDQIACLKNIHRHLNENGRLMLNFFTPILKLLLDCNTHENSEFKELDTYTHPETGEEIKLSFSQTNDLAEQIQHITWRFQIMDKQYETPMLVSWIYKKEFELLAKISGFKVIALYSGFQHAPYNGEGEMVWILEKRK